VSRYEMTVGPLDGRVGINEKESQTLAAQRDALLPKLISGDIRVKDGEEYLEAV